MDLPTHFFFGIAVGFVFFGRPEIALMIGLGSLLPDLDRDYWFIPRRASKSETIHRAGLHNVFLIALAYLVSPFLALGIFLHGLLDSFTTVKDRGVEWFFPLTRPIKRGLYDADGRPQPLDPKEQIYFYHQDVGEQGPIPWRRIYGPALNSHLLDRGFLYGSLSIIFVWLLGAVGAPRLRFFTSYLASNYVPWTVGFGAILILFAAGELGRRDRPVRLANLDLLKYPVFALGLALFATWLGLTQAEVSANLRSVFSDPVSVVAAAVLIPLVALGVKRWHTRAGKRAIF